ncbi:MAG: hypothetical protein ACREQ9_13885 [Candidatus Binatia bacterium]
MRSMLLAAAIAVLAIAGTSGADVVCTDLGCASVNEGGYVVVADGAAGNPDPADGFISVSSDGVVCADDNGTADDGDPNNGPESQSPTCAP